MPVERPTFHESWYRVADQRSQLRSTVQTYRQQYRGQMWHVLCDPSNNQFFRLNDAAYHFVGLLDGRRTVDEVWQTCNDQLGDAAPTQNEAIQLLGQLYAANLLHGEMPADAEGMFERYRKRLRREVGGYMMNLLFIRIPLIDPDHFLNRWIKVFSWVFGWFGFLLWAGLLITGGYFIISRLGELWHGINYVLDRDNLVYLYLSFAVIKVFHEFGHGFACKRYGLQRGSGGEVHTMGIMFLVFMPVPYVDASSAWALRSKWQRLMISAAGMYVELAIAAVAAIVWAQTREGHVAHTIAYNVMFIASISTLLFNGNPLLRFDGYYILSDLLEVPNLSQRGKDYVYYLIKKYVYGVRRARTTAHGASEKQWLVFYAMAATTYRVFISIRILMFVADKLFFVGAILAIVSVFTWVLIPLGKWVKYLATSPELMRSRHRAVTATAVFFLILIGMLGAIPFPDHIRAEAFVEPRDLVNVHAGAPGFVVSVCESAQPVNPDGDPLLVSENRYLRAQFERQLAEKKVVERQRAIAITREPAAAEAMAERVMALDREIEELRKQISRLRITAPISGLWVAPDIDRLIGAFIQPGDQIGRVVGTEHLIVRALAQQTVGPRIDAINHRLVEMRMKGRPDIYFKGIIFKVLPAGFARLPTPSMGYAAEGGLAVDPTDPEGTKTTDNFFEVHILPATIRVNVINKSTQSLKGRIAIRVSATVDGAAHRTEQMGTLHDEDIDLDAGASTPVNVDVCLPKGAEEKNYRFVATVVAVDVQQADGGSGVAMEVLGGEANLEGMLIAEIDKNWLLPGQRVVVRFETGLRPLAFQWWQSVRQLVQRRFNI